MGHQLLKIAQEVHAEVVEDRRWLHRNPELSYEERETSEYIAKTLREIGLQPETNIGGYGVRAVIRGNRPGRTVALRADIDALPIHEETGLSFASTKPGKMHACGHDAHTAMLLGAARGFVKLDGDFAGTIVLIFQPAEEVAPGGAIKMVEDGVLKNPDVDAIFGLHIGPFLPSGHIFTAPGPINASSDRFEIIVKGKGGHAAAPHTTIDPIPASAQVIMALQHIVSRNVKPGEPAVVTVGSIHGGTVANVIEPEVRMIGTIRSRDDKVREQIPKWIERAAKGAASAHGCEATVIIEVGYPVVVNTEYEASVARRAALNVLGDEKVEDLEPSMGAEDFSNFLKEVPGAFSRVGVAPPHDDELYPAHNSRLKVDEDAFVSGVAYWLSVALEYTSGVDR